MVCFKQIKRYNGAVMNEDNKINFAYIAGKEHAAVSITQNQYNQILNILYGKEKV